MWQFDFGEADRGLFLREIRQYRRARIARAVFMKGGVV